MVGVIKEMLTSNHSSHASQQIDENTHVLQDGLINMVNHCCKPNCGIRVNETGAHDFVAMKDINVNEEATFDYAMRNYSIDQFRKNCMCGANNFRGKITGWKDLSDEKKKAYDGFVAPYLLVLDAKKSLSRVRQSSIHNSRKRTDVLQATLSANASGQ